MTMSEQADDKRRDFRDRPLHDWTSHGADAWRTLATGRRKSDDSDYAQIAKTGRLADGRQAVITEYNMFG